MNTKNLLDIDETRLKNVKEIVQDFTISYKDAKTDMRIIRNNNGDITEILYYNPVGCEWGNKIRFNWKEATKEKTNEWDILENNIKEADIDQATFEMNLHESIVINNVKIDCDSIELN